MENKSDDFLGNIYTSYGPMIGKACENTNVLFNNNNLHPDPDVIVESVTSSVNESIKKMTSLKINSPVQTNNTINLKQNKNSSTELKTKNVKITEDTGNFINNNNDNDNDNNNSNSISSYFNYKVSIFSYKISIWILILVLIILLCIGYFIYKYCYLSNNFVFYKKSTSNNNLSLEKTSNDKDDQSVISKNLSNTIDTESEANTTSSSSISSLGSKNNISKSSKLTK